MKKDEWQHVTDCTFVTQTIVDLCYQDVQTKAYTERLRVPGGWLYRVTMGVDEGTPSVTLCFVPTP